MNGKALGLPFWKKSQEIVALAQAGRGIVVLPTGTGKTTQTPQALHEAGFTDRGEILVSVPKRVLAVELAARVADEMGVPLGGLVGYEIRGERRVSSATRIRFLTEGMLRAKIRGNPSLGGVSAVLLDEFHQRSLTGDFNAALIERAQDSGAKVAMLIMSATADAAVLAAHFRCGVVDGSGLTTVYPIRETYRKVGDGLAEDAAAAVRDMVIRHGGSANGIVFMPGKGEIEQAVAAINRLKLDGVRVLPLHGDLDRDDRHAPFVERPGVATVTVATDIVETGATLPNVAWVVDSGLAREVGYDPLSDTSALRLVPVARDRLTQRRGRAGRVRPGDYVGLFSEEERARRPERTDPEIFRKPLREVVLTVKALGFSREEAPLRLPDYPAKENWKAAKKQLQLLGFVDQSAKAEITDLGRKAVELGCDPRDAAILIAGAESGCLREAATAIAARESRLFVRPRNEAERPKAQAAHERFKVSRVCDAWKSVLVARAAESRGEQGLGAWCRENYVSYRALQEVWTAARQHLSTMRRLGFSESENGTEEQLRRAICAGLPDRVFVKSRRGYYTGDSTDANPGNESSVYVAAGQKVAVWEIVEIRGRRYATNVTVPVA